MNTIPVLSKSYFQHFQSNIGDLALPTQFTYPFYYEVHPLARLAAEELQRYLQTQQDWEHNFGLEEGQAGMVIGKMFGVLVVQKKDGELGYIAAFSGKLAKTNEHKKFVPPIYDILQKDGFYVKGEAKLRAMTAELETLESAVSLEKSRFKYQKEKTLAEETINTFRKKRINGKKSRRNRRKVAQETLSAKEHLQFEAKIKAESLLEQQEEKKAKAYWQLRLATYKELVDEQERLIQKLKRERKAFSASVQQKIFAHYSFLNAEGERKDLNDIFKNSPAIIPPAGAGECAAPKLLQYAFLQEWKPVALAEFWWGASPKSEVRKHGYYYPACKGKCQPILGHMLQGLDVEENPLLTNPALGKKLSTVYEDEYLVVINKPADFFSVPGKTINDSVATRMRKKYPEATGPMIVHRLDASTSGLMLIAKTKKVHEYLQKQFTARTIKKRYTALLEEEIQETKGSIDLPLRVDLEDRPRQMVCYEHGKSAKTFWEVIDVKDGKTLIHLYPVTGRTHQLRVHCAHPLGLNASIVGDDLYGQKEDRLHLHAAFIEFEHPIFRKRMKMKAEAIFA